MVAPGKQVLAVVAVMLLVHFQIAWACADMAAMERSDCCVEHSSSCESTPPADGLCMEPLSVGTTPVLPHNPADLGDDGSDVSSVEDLERARAAVFTRRSSTGPPGRAAPEYRTSRIAQLTYLTTLRLRV